MIKNQNKKIGTPIAGINQNGVRGSSQFVFVFGVPAFATHEKEQLKVWCLRVVVVNLEILLKTLATMVRKEKQWEVEDKNLRTMGTENSRQIQIRISGHHFLRGGGVLLHQLLFVCRT